VKHVARDPEDAYEWLTSHGVDVATATVVRGRLDEGESVVIIGLYGAWPQPDGTVTIGDGGLA
jgi:hypothetical protein